MASAAELGGQARQAAGVVLHLGAVGESHRCVELLTAEHGRLILLARGARASRRRFAGSLMPFASLRVQLQPGRGAWPSLTAADVQTARLSIRSSLPRILRASALCTCARHLAPEGQAAPMQLRLLAWGLDAVAAGAVGAAARAFPRLAQAAGILPRLDACGACGRAVANLRLTAAGLACGACQPAAPPLTPALAAALAGAVPADLQVADALEQCILSWVGHHVGRPLARQQRAVAPAPAARLAPA